jgi:hypothetical protein
MATRLAERSAHPRSIGLESQLPKHDVPGLTVAEFERRFLGGAKIAVLPSNVRTSLEELGDALLVPGVLRRPVQRGEAIITHDARVSPFDGDRYHGTRWPSPIPGTLAPLGESVACGTIVAAANRYTPDLGTCVQCSLTQ